MGEKKLTANRFIITMEEVSDMDIENLNSADEIRSRMEQLKNDCRKLLRLLPVEEQKRKTDIVGRNTRRKYTDNLPKDYLELILQDTCINHGLECHVDVLVE